MNNNKAWDLVDIPREGVQLGTNEFLISKEMQVDTLKDTKYAL